jgi:hypothetical protein
MFFYSQPEFYVGTWNLIYQEDFESTPQDLIYYSRTGPNSHGIVGSAGQLVDHSTLQNPLTQNGQKCWNIPVNNGHLEAAITTQQTFTQNDKKAISVRAWMRSGYDPYSQQSLMSRMLFNEWVPKGYCLRVTPGKVYLGNFETPANSVQTAQDEYDIYTWKQMRLDVIPGTNNGIEADKLVAYVNTDESTEAWVKILETIIPSNVGSYVGWDPNKYNGVQLRDGSSAGNTYNTYFDKLQLFVADI